MRQSIEEMIYDFKLKVDKLDSKDFTDLPIPQIIRLLNEAQIDIVIERYGQNNLYRAGFEGNQKRIDELSDLIVPEETVIMKSLYVTDQTYPGNKDIYISDLTNTKKKYLFLLRCNFTAKPENCSSVLINGIQTSTDDLDRILNSPFECPSLEWRETPYRITNQSLRAYSDSSFTISNAIIDYLRYPNDMDLAGYTHMDNTASTTIECELPDFLKKSVVDRAVILIKTSLKDNIQYDQVKQRMDE